MMRFEVSEGGQGTLPAIDLAEQPVVIGSGPDARLRLPASVARPAHVRIADGKWVALGELVVDGKPRAAGEDGPLGEVAVLEIGSYRVRVTSAPTDAPASTPQRTESIARELVRAMLGAGAAPSFEITRGPDRGSLRALPPPEATIVIGRGDDADWIILDEDLSRAHAEIRRGWDGVTIRDRGSKNGTLVDGVAATTDTVLHDGATITMGNVVLRFRDPAEAHLVGGLTPAPREPTPPPVRTATRTSAPIAPVAAAPLPAPRWWLLASSSTIAVLALVALAYVLAD